VDQTGDLALPDITFLDYLAFAFYVASWVGYTLFADYSPWRRRNIMQVMDAYHEQWMRQMLRREHRIVDANIIGSLQNGAAFFASTTIFALGGLIAALGASEQAMGILSTLHMDEFATAETWQVKVLLLIAIMAYAFFKFAWTFRLQNYCAVLLGATSVETEPGPEDTAMALRVARISALAARHFNRGLRAYFFALAALAWFVHPVLFMVMIVYVLYVLHRREFRSKSLKVLRIKSDELS
jgi:uncharacterized membrane protein